MKMWIFPVNLSLQPVSCAKHPAELDAEKEINSLIGLGAE